MFCHDDADGNNKGDKDDDDDDEVLSYTDGKLLVVFCKDRIFH